MSWIDDLLSSFKFSMGTKPGPSITKNIQSTDNTFVNSLGMIDIELYDQGGQFNTAYDDSFIKARDKIGVSASLMKAHAIRESALKHSAYRLEPSGKASYGLMQVLWWKNSNRFQKYGYSDDMIGDGSLLYSSDENCIIAANIILENWQRFGNLRDTINAYNTGVAESRRAAPGNYVNDVIRYYSTLVGRSVT